jgi:hypothetical protein
MGEINATPKRMHQGGITLLALLRCIPLPLDHRLLRHSTLQVKKWTIQRRKLQEIALIQIGNGYSGEGDEDIRSSWDVSVRFYRNFE